MVTPDTRGIWGKAPRFPPIGLQPLDSYAHRTYCLESVKPHEWARSGKARFLSHAVGRGRCRVGTRRSSCPRRGRDPGSAREESHGVVQFGCSPRTHHADGGGRPCAWCESEGHPDLGRCRKDPVLPHVRRPPAVPAVRGTARDRRTPWHQAGHHRSLVGKRRQTSGAPWELCIARPACPARESDRGCVGVGIIRRRPLCCPYISVVSVVCVGGPFASEGR